MEIERAQGAGDPSLERLRRFAHWLDDGIPVPGTRLRVGLDPIIGLIPGVGDAAGAVLAGWILLEAARRGTPRPTLVRMALNIGIDALVGAVPILGDLFDFVWKANLRNVALIERQAVDPARAGKTDRLFLTLLAAVVIAICGTVTVGGVVITVRLLERIVGS